MSLAALTFGFLTFIDDKISFVVLAYSLRMLEGVAAAILWTAMLSLLMARQGDPFYAVKSGAFMLYYLASPTTLAWYTL